LWHNCFQRLVGMFGSNVVLSRSGVVEYISHSNMFLMFVAPLPACCR
jgi:hypothetical protein